MMNRTIGFIGMFCFAACLCAQTESLDEKTSPSPSTQSTEQRVSQEPITIIHLPDENGELVPTFGGITYDEIKQFIEQRFARSRDARPQNIEIKSLRLAGVAHDDHADLKVSLNIGTATGSDANDEWLQIPFLFAGSAITSEPTVSNGGICSAFRRQNGGYDFWIRTSQSETYDVEFDIAVPLSVVGDVTKMQITVPTATVSELTITVPEEVTAEFTNVVTDSSKAEGNITTLQAKGLSKTVGISWKRGDFQSLKSNVRLEARGEIRCTIERLGVVTSDIGLQLKSFGTAIDRFVVRIPQSSTPISGDQPNYTMRELAADEGGGRLVEFKLNGMYQEPPEIRFRLETNLSEAVSNQESAFEVAAIEVMGAFRQYGQVELYSRADLKISWESKDARRIGNLERSERDASSRLVAVFEYTKQPCRIRINIKQQQSRVTVEPIHVLTVQSDRLNLESQFNYSVRGARATGFEFEFGNWEPLSIRSPLLREEFDFVKTDTGANIILGEPVANSFVVESTTSRSLEQLSGKIELLLPRAAAEFTSSGFLLIDSSDNVELKFPAEAIPGFRPTRIPGNLAETYSENKYYCFRVIDDQQNPSAFPLDYTVQSQKIDARSETQISLQSASAKVVQKIDYDVRYVPRTQIDLAIPAKIAERFFGENHSNDFFVTVNNQPVTLNVPVRQIFDDDTSVSVSLGETTLGRISIQIEYDWPIEESDTLVSQLEFPLVSVADQKSISNSLRISSATGVTVNGILSSDSWIDEGSDDSEPDYTYRASSNVPETSVVISVNQPDDVSNDIDEPTIPTIVNRAWIQSLFGVGKRNDRAVFQVTTIETELRIRIPLSVEFGDLFVLVDHQEVKPEFTGQTLTIPVKSGMHTIEIFMPFASRQRVGSMSVELPEILDAKAHNMWQWLLVLPPSEHVLLNPDGLRAANAWTWTGTHWQRKNNMTQQQLESWSNASTQPGPGDANQYLFNSFLRRSQIRIKTANKRWLVGVGSGATLAFGLSMIYLKPVRKPIVLFLTAFSLALCAYLFPVPATLLAQASIMGAVLAFIGQLLSLIIQRLAVDRQSLPVVRRQSDSHTYSSLDNDISNLSTADFPHQPISVVTSDSKA